MPYHAVKKYMNKDEIYMQRALELASLGRGAVSPNPMVGCVIVHDDKIIGEGYHRRYGGAHAEPNAIADVSDPELLKSAIAYVTLEPCSHYGKTGPCAQLLVANQIKKVVIAVQDPNPLVSGKGIKILEDGGAEVVVGVLEKQAMVLNKRFFTQIQKKRPYIILKWAQTQDGYLARADYDSKWISNPYSRQLVHRWRGEEDAIMVGTKTAYYDNPKLNVRDWTGRDPVRVVIDQRLILDDKMFLFDGSQPTICYNLHRNKVAENLSFVKLKKDFGIRDILDDLYDRKIQSLIVEGGNFLLQKFIAEDVWDEARVFIGKVKFGEGIPAPKLGKHPFEQIDIMGDDLQVYYP